MNFLTAQRSLRLAIIFRDSARWHAQHGAPSAAAVCRTRMRIAAKTMVNSARAMEALAQRQTARDLSPFCFQPLDAA